MQQSYPDIEDSAVAEEREYCKSDVSNSLSALTCEGHLAGSPWYKRSNADFLELHKDDEFSRHDHHTIAYFDIICSISGTYIKHAQPNARPVLPDSQASSGHLAVPLMLMTQNC